MAREPADSRPATRSAPFIVGRWRVDPATDVVELDGRACKLQPRTMRLLVTLAGRPGEVLSGQELLDAVWPGVVVTDQSLYQAIG
ncbi:MAG TPA: winged helix-turn-helix domain-containing protein, partial [Burkholderiaceae bacterium]|nr:winged helix-turn-helix domain-containing protein [Burkholderiaceae bacterium]